MTNPAEQPASTSLREKVLCLINNGICAQTHTGVIADAILAAIEAERDALRKIADAARNLASQKGRHNTEQAYTRLAAAIAAQTGDQS